MKDKFENPMDEEERFDEKVQCIALHPPCSA